VDGIEQEDEKLVGVLLAPSGELWGELANAELEIAGIDDADIAPPELGGEPRERLRSNAASTQSVCRVDAVPPNRRLEMADERHRVKKALNGRVEEAGVPQVL
jgi:hypothetical protein